MPERMIEKVRCLVEIGWRSSTHEDLGKAQLRVVANVPVARLGVKTVAKVLDRRLDVSDPHRVIRKREVGARGLKEVVGVLSDDATGQLGARLGRSAASLHQCQALDA